MYSIFGERKTLQQKMFYNLNFKSQPLNGISFMVHF